MKDDKVPFDSGDLIEIFDKEGNKIFELEYTVKGYKASFVPKEAYENSIDKLKELYTKQSINKALCLDFLKDLDILNKLCLESLKEFSLNTKESLCLFLRLMMDYT